MKKYDALTDETYPTRHISQARQKGKDAAESMLSGTFPEEWVRAFVAAIMDYDKAVGDVIAYNHEGENLLVFMAGHILSRVSK